MTIDAILLLAALELARRVRPWFNQWLWVKEIPADVVLPSWLYLAVIVVFLAAFLGLNLYDGRHYIRWIDEFFGLIVGTFWAVFTLAGLMYWSYREVSRLLFILFVGIAFLSLAGIRALVRLIWRKRGASLPHRRILVIGDGNLAREVAHQLQDYRHMGLQFVGYLGMTRQNLEINEQILGGLTELFEVIQKNIVDGVVIALPRSAYLEVTQLVTALHDLPVKVWLVPDYFSLALYKARVEDFAGLPVFDLRAPALNEFQRMLKRGFDLALTLVLLPFVIPVMALISLAIYFDDKGSLLFRQNRVGENGRIFTIYKFRTMVENAEKMRDLAEWVDESGHQRYKNKDDPRVTKVGKFLRRTSLDELPQLLNVLRGEMSLVGPRPELPHLVAQYQPWQRKRFVVQPGITGWWQVNGRSEHPLYLNTKDDLYYIQNYSLWMDIKILIKTIWIVLQGKGAY